MPRRYLVGAFCFTALLIGYMDRANLSVVAPVLMAELGWDPGLMGLMHSAFYVGFALSHVPAGWLADRFGGKPVLLGGCAIWSLATGATALVSRPAAMFGVRTVLGVGEGGNFPAINALLVRWFPTREITRAISFVTTGVFAGNVVATPVAAFVMAAYGWRAVFYLFGAVGLAWVLLAARTLRPTPEDDPAIAAAERDEILRTRGYRADGDRTPLSWRALLARRGVWALAVTIFCNNFAIIMLSVWTPAYLMQGLGLSVQEMGIVGTLPYLAMILAMSLGGWVSDALINRGWRKVVVRRLAVAGGYAVGLVFLGGLLLAETTAGAVACLTLVQGSFAFGQSTFVVNAIDLGPRHAGTIQGFTVTASDGAGAFAPAIAGYLIGSVGYAGVFWLAGGLLLAGGTVWLTLSEAEEVFG